MELYFKKNRFTEDETNCKIYGAHLWTPSNSQDWSKEIPRGVIEIRARKENKTGLENIHIPWLFPVVFKQFDDVIRTVI